MASIRLGLAYDFRNPPASGLDNPALYSRLLSQIKLADTLGYASIWLTEHHFVEDGYMPSFPVAAAAIAAVTTRVEISSDILLLPFHHPIRLAEDLAVVDNLANGRLMLGVGMGYAPHEFRAFGVERRHRVSLLEEGIEVLRRAWTDDRLSFAGRRWRFDDVPVRPRPVPRPGAAHQGPPIWMAAMSEPAARRAARLGAHLLPQGRREMVLDPWRDELAKLGRDPAAYRVGIIRPWLVTDEADRLWPRIREAERYRLAQYAQWFGEAGDQEMLGGGSAAGTRGGGWIPQSYIVGDADHVAGELARFAAEYGFTDVVSWGAPPGIEPELMNESHERFAREVMPRLFRKS